MCKQIMKTMRKLRVIDVRNIRNQVIEFENDFVKKLFKIMNPKPNRYLKTNKPSDIKIDIYSFNFEVFNDNLRVWYNENSKQFTHEGEFCFSYKKGDDYGYLDFPKEVIEEVNICQKCFGTGILDSGPSCSMPASECCGGCYEQVDCECETPFYVG